MEAGRLAKRGLGRTGRPIAPFMWRVSEAGLSDSRIETILRLSMQAGIDWLFVDSTVPGDLLERLGRVLVSPGGRWSLVMGIEVDGLNARAADWLMDRLDALGIDRCEAAMVQGASGGDIKSGGPFHRLTQLRDRGLCSLFFVEAEDCPTAEWMVENTPSHAVVVPFGLLDQTAKYRILGAAVDIGTAIIASPVVQPAWNPQDRIEPESDLAFALSEPAVVSALRDLPATEADLQHLLAAAGHPMPQEQRQLWWERFQQAVPPPPRPRGGHPPEFAG